MTINYNPRVVYDGLVLALDAANAKSYLGYWSPTLSNGANAFDGSLSTAAGSLGGTFGPYTYTFANPIAITSARMYVTLGATSGQVGSTTNVFLVNGIDVTQKAKNANLYTPTAGWIDVTAEAGSNWSTFQFTGTSGSTNPAIYAIEINGKIIVGNYNGTTWTDLSGNGNNGTLTNGVGYNNSNGGSLSFDGVNDYINGVHNTQLNITGNITVECWFRVTNTRSDWVRVFGKGDATNRTVGLWYNQPSSTFLYQRYGTSNMSLVYSATVSLNTWYHMVGTSSGNNHTLYLNNVIRGTSTTGTTFASSTDPYKVGYGNVHTYHIGNVSNCRIYNKALTAAEVQQNFNALRGRYGI